MDSCRLRIGMQASRLVIDDLGRGAATVPTETCWPVGYANVCPGPFRASPPTELEIEQAIETVEDRIMPTLAPLLHSPIRPSALRVAITPVTMAGDAVAVSASYPLPATLRPNLSIEAIETAFSSLAASAGSRRHLGGDGWSEPSAAAILVIVRETMHHGGFSQVCFEPEPLEPEPSKAVPAA